MSFIGTHGRRTKALFCIEGGGSSAAFQAGALEKLIAHPDIEIAGLAAQSISVVTADTIRSGLALGRSAAIPSDVEREIHARQTAIKAMHEGWDDLGAYQKEILPQFVRFMDAGVWCLDSSVLEAWRKSAERCLPQQPAFLAGFFAWRIKHGHDRYAPEHAASAPPLQIGTTLHEAHQNPWLARPEQSRAHPLNELPRDLQLRLMAASGCLPGCEPVGGLGDGHLHIDGGLSAPIPNYLQLAKDCVRDNTVMIILRTYAENAFAAPATAPEQGKLGALNDKMNAMIADINGELGEEQFGKSVLVVAPDTIEREGRHLLPEPLRFDKDRIALLMQQGRVAGDQAIARLGLPVAVTQNPVPAARSKAGAESGMFDAMMEIPFLPLQACLGMLGAFTPR